MKIKNFQSISPKDPLIDDGTVCTSCSNRLATPPPQTDVLFPMDISQIYQLPLEKCFL